MARVKDRTPPVLVPRHETTSWSSVRVPRERHKYARPCECIEGTGIEEYSNSTFEITFKGHVYQIIDEDFCLNKVKGLVDVQAMDMETGDVVTLRFTR